MSASGDRLEIRSSKYWYKVVDMLQQNWALVEGPEGGKVTAYFITDTSGVFDMMSFPTLESAHSGLRRNGFQRLDEDASAQSFLTPPPPPFRLTKHPNGAIYSSGEFWLT